MNNIDPLDEADLRNKMRQMYRDIGFDGSLQCLYELLCSTNILIEIIKEEYDAKEEN